MAASVALRLDLPMTLASSATFADGVREHQDEVYGVALRITGDRDAALDVASSTFLKAYRAFHRYDRTRPLRHWLLRIATNEAISYVRKRGRELRRSVEVEQATAVADSNATPDAESVAREDRARIRAAVRQLPGHRPPLLQRAERRRDRARHRPTRLDGRRPAPSGPRAPARRSGERAMRNDRREDDLFDEVRLRRALRLEAAELPPRMDLATIAAQAEAHRPASVFAALLSTAVAGAAAAALAGLVLVALPTIAPAVASEAFDAAIQTLARAAVPASAILAAAQQPGIPLAATFALAVAVAYEYTQRRERARAVSS